MTTTVNTSPLAALLILLRALKLPTIARHAEEVAQLAERDGWTFVHYLHHLVELESDERRRWRIERNRRQSELPADKTLATLKRSRLPAKVAKMLPTLCEGSFVERGDNLLAFGRPGRGKTHLVCAIGHELIQRGYRVLFIATYALVQRLLAAKRDLLLEEELETLDGFDAVILDDIGYVQQNRDEMEVLFTFLAERYERRTVMITSNLVFSEWDRIFKDPMTTAAAIDRLVHHSVILEMTGSSIRIEEAQARPVAPKEASTRTSPSPPPPTTRSRAQHRRHLARSRRQLPRPRRQLPRAPRTWAQPDGTWPSHPYPPRTDHQGGTHDRPQAADQATRSPTPIGVLPGAPDDGIRGSLIDVHRLAAA
jgi:DNA replication protein DnaC